MSPEQDLMLSEILNDAVNAEYDELRSRGVDSVNAQLRAKIRVREAIKGLILDRLSKAN